MRVKVGDRWFDSEDGEVAVAVQFERDELKFIKESMPLDEGDRKFASGLGLCADDLRQWVRDEIYLSAVGPKQ